MTRNKLKKSSLTLAIFSSLFLSSCASVPDVPLCAEISLSKGTCTYTVSSKNIIVDDDNLLDGQTWFDLRAKALTVPAESWAKLKAFLVKQCKKHKCDVDISSWDRNISDQ